MKMSRLFWHCCVPILLMLGGSHSKPLEINETNWRDTLEGEWMIEFMAPWCPACRGFTEIWDKFSEWNRNLDISVGIVDVTENPGLSGRFLVTALPTIYHAKDGVFRQYLGGRKEDDLVSFVDDKKWKVLEPGSWWISPNTPQMTTVGLFFKAAMQMRALYDVMRTDYGVPEWGCYGIFALFTIAVGLLLGLLIVCCCDMMLPVKAPMLPPPELEPEEDLADLDEEEEEESEEEHKDGDAEVIEDDKSPEEDNDTTARRRRPPEQKSE